MTDNSKIDSKDQLVMLRIKSLLNSLRYIIKDEHLEEVDKFYDLCRKYCSWPNKVGKDLRIGRKLQ